MKVGIYVTCAVCQKQKKPVGRSAPFQMYLCDSECEGYYEWPKVGSLWPRETEEEFGYPVGVNGTSEV